MKTFVNILMVAMLVCVTIIAATGALLAVGAAHEWWECKSFSKKYKVAVEWGAFRGCYVPELDMYVESIKGDK